MSGSGSPPEQPQVSQQVTSTTGGDPASQAREGSNEPFEWDFFLAYARADRSRAESLYAALSTNHRVFLDARAVRPGDDWPRTISRALAATRLTIILISASSEEAHYLHDEISTAIQLARKDAKRRRVIPVFLDGFPSNVTAVPYGLGSIQGLDARKLGMEGIAVELRQAAARQGAAVSQAHESSRPAQAENHTPMSPLPKVLRDSIARLTSQEGGFRGTCFLISRRHVLTCHHCVSSSSGGGSSRFKVQFLQAKGGPTSSAEVVWTFPKHDMAVLELEEEQKLTPISLGEPHEASEWSTFGYSQDDAQLLDGDAVAYPVKLGMERETEPGWVTVNSYNATHNLDGISGAPVIVGGQAIGVITHQRRAANGAVSVPAAQTLLAIPIHHLSTAHEMIRRASHHEQHAPGFCPDHHKLRTVLSKKSRLHAGSEVTESNLHYLVIQVPASSTFPGAKRRLLNRIKKEVSRGNITDPAVWTLLGSAEFLVTFRASQQDAKTLSEELDEEFLSDQQERAAVRIMDISQEMVLETEPAAGQNDPKFRPGRLTLQDPVSSKKLRSARAFIRLYLERDISQQRRDAAVDSILAVAHEFRSVVERVSITREKDTVMIDVHMACGLLPALSQLSAELEHHLGPVQRKDTFLAYDQIWPEAARVGEAAPRTVEGSV